MLGATDSPSCSAQEPRQQLRAVAAAVRAGAEPGLHGVPLSFDNPPAACGPGNACMSRPLYPHAFLLPTGEYFLCWIKCAPVYTPSGMQTRVESESAG